MHDRQLCSEAALAEGITKWMNDAGLALGSTASISSGPNPLSATFSLRMAGLPIEADRRARKSLQVLKRSDGAWEQLFVKLPNGQQAQIYISPDRSAKQVFSKQCCKRLLAAVRALYPQLQVHLLKL